MIPPLEPPLTMPAAAPADLKGAAAAFESMLLRQFLAQAMPDAQGSAGLAAQALADRLASAGPFGIARLLTAADGAVAGDSAP